jgi:hypothetical protein
VLWLYGRVFRRGDPGRVATLAEGYPPRNHRALPPLESPAILRPADCGGAAWRKTERGGLA